MNRLSEKELNILRGKALVGHASVEEMMKLFFLMDEMESLLDEGDLEDFYGTEGWRRRLGWED